MIELQRVYEHERRKGTHFLVERLWPRGIAKESLHFRAWLKDVAPSTALRQWFGHDVPKWAEFQRRYRAELDQHPEVLTPLLEAARAGDVVLLYSSRIPSTTTRWSCATCCWSASRKAPGPRPDGASMRRGGPSGSPTAVSRREGRSGRFAGLGHRER